MISLYSDACYLNLNIPFVFSFDEMMYPVAQTAFLLSEIHSLIIEGLKVEARFYNAKDTHKGLMRLMMTEFINKQCLLGTVEKNIFKKRKT